MIKQLQIIPISMRMYRIKGNKTFQNKLIPTSSGVYFLWSNYELLYIGKAQNLRYRIAQHIGNGFLQQRMINPDEAKKVSIIFTKDLNDAEELEKELLKLIPTKWNKVPLYKREWYDDWRFKKGIFESSCNSV